MIEYQYCPSCGFPIFYFQEKYNRDRENKLKNVTELPEYARTNTDNEKNTDDIFDKYGIKNLCCRARMLTGTSFVKDVATIFEGKPLGEPVSSDKLLEGSYHFKNEETQDY